jgi:hypothetical protein
MTLPQKMVAAPQAAMPVARRPPGMAVDQHADQGTAERISDDEGRADQEAHQRVRNAEVALDRLHQ